MSRAPSSNRYVPVSMPMQMPVGLQRAYYYPEHMAPDYADEEMDQASSAGHPYPNWMETPGGGEQDHSPVKQSEMAVVNRDSHHMQVSVSAFYYNFEIIDLYFDYWYRKTFPYTSGFKKVRILSNRAKF